MKRTIFILLAITLTFSVSLAADVGNGKSHPLQTYSVLQPSFEMPVSIIPVTPFEMLPQVCVSDLIIPEVGFLATQFKPDAFTFIDPGICAQVSVTNMINPKEHQLYAQRYLPTARHVSFS